MLCYSYLSRFVGTSRIIQKIIYVDANLCSELVWAKTASLSSLCVGGCCHRSAELVCPVGFL